MQLIDLVRFSNLSALAEKAGLLEINTFVVAKSFESEKELMELNKKIKEFKGKVGFKQAPEFKTCLLLKEASSRKLHRLRKKVDLVAVVGGTLGLNEFAVSVKGVDLLLMPQGTKKPAFDTALARTAAEHCIPIAFLFSDFLNALPYQKSCFLKNCFFAVKLCNRFKVNCLFFTGAYSPSELRCIKNLSSFAALLGFSKEQGKRFTQSFPKTLFEKKGLEGFKVLKQ